MTVRELYEYAVENGCEDTEVVIDAKSISDEYVADVVSKMNSKRLDKNPNAEWLTMDSDEIMNQDEHSAYGNLDMAAYGDGLVLGYHDVLGLI